MGKELHKIIAPEDFHDSHKKGFTKFNDTGTGAAVDKTLELRAIRKDGTEFPIELSQSSVKIKDKWSAIGIVRDITDRKQSKKNLKDKMEQLEKYKKVTVGRELKMMKLKKQIKELELKCNDNIGGE